MCHQQLGISFFSLLLLATPLMAIWELEKNVYVVEVEWDPDAPVETVVLTCDSSENENAITWTSNKNGQILGTGKTLTVQVREFTDAGTYICQKGGEVLSRKLLLIRVMEDGIWSTDIVKDQKEPKTKTYLKCEAKNYSGTFTCSWLTESSPGLKFSIRSSKGSSDPRGVTCGPAVLSEEKVKIDNKEYQKYTADCQEVSACPSAEESQPIEVVLDAIQKHKYEKYTSSFFVRDIIKPDPPRNLRVKPLKNSRIVELSWEYPETWSTPHSYFPLNFNVQVHGRGKKEKTSVTTETSVQVECHKGKKILVQARDRYYNSSWSKWASVTCEYCMK
ncbi:interleukin-12 subunit beta [Trichosurus vulpecula]|uniref:interleukin-12 subunit beta n=1 Tax=Trichosurus vulpecula TaxID=9337 RepID=UPI00186AD485|nr:interleukin-12 subunit beta [Trichosurus vulpecula]